MNLHLKSPGEAQGFYPLVTRGKQLKYLSFSILELGDGLKEYSFESGEEELSLDFYSGAVAIEVEGAAGRWRTEIAPRPSITEAAPMVYVPSGSKVRVKSTDGPAKVTIAGAQGKPGARPVKIDGAGIVSKKVGKDNWARTVFTHIAGNVDAAHLICGETLNQPGGWSSCPPHKHDRFDTPFEVAPSEAPPSEVPPSEVPMEEVYYFQVEPRQGFGFMRVYTSPADADPFDVSYAVEHGDTVLIPRGYHPVVACPGYALNYTWILAGEGRTYGAWSDDPKHTWIKGA
jgi:5-deoxy-glucuronate isomerase